MEPQSSEGLMGGGLQASPPLVCSTHQASEECSGSCEGSPARTCGSPLSRATRVPPCVRALSTPTPPPTRHPEIRLGLSRTLPRFPLPPSSPAASPSAGFWKVLTV